MRKIRIFFISPSSIRNYQEKQKRFVGSPEYRIFRGFVDKGYDVHLIMPANQSNARSFSYSGILIHEFKIPPMPPTAKNLMSKLMRRLTHYILFTIFSTRKLMHTIKKYGKPDVIYSLSSAGCITSFVTSTMLRVPNVTRLYGTFLYPHLRNFLHAFFYNFEEFIAFKIPCRYLIITNDGTRGDIVSKTLKVPSERVKYWMNGVDFESDSDFDAEGFKKALGIPSDVHIILSVCRLVKWKGVHRLIEATPSFVSDRKAIVILIIGDGIEKKNLENLSERLNVKKFVRFLGAIPHSEVIKYMRIADIFVSLQDLSNVSSSLLEAMTCGRCVVTLNTGATSEIVKDGQNGAVLEPDKLSDLPKLIVRLLDDKRLRRKLGSEAKSYSRKHFLSWRERVKIEIELIEGLFIGNQMEKNKAYFLS